MLIHHLVWYESAGVLRHHRVVLADTQAAGDAVDYPSAIDRVMPVVGFHRGEPLVYVRRIGVDSVGCNARLPIDHDRDIGPFAGMYWLSDVVPFERLERRRQQVGAVRITFVQ